MPIFTGTAMWCFTVKPDTKYEPCWRITLVMSDEEANKLKALGVKVKRNDDGKYEFKFKRNVTNKKGAANRQPIVVDANKEEFDKIIGNGSSVRVIAKPYTWEFKGRKGVGMDLDKIQVLEHVSYGGDEDFDDKPVEDTPTPQAKEEDEEF